MTSNGPASPAMIHSCMLINEMARNNPSEKSDTIASARVLAGQRILGSNLGTVSDNRMAVNRQETNNDGFISMKLSSSHGALPRTTCFVDML